MTDTEGKRHCYHCFAILEGLKYAARHPDKYDADTISVLIEFFNRAAWAAHHKYR